MAVLRSAGCVFAEEEARLLTEAARGPAELARLVAERIAGAPLEHVLGWALFCGLRVAVSPGVFVPRRRTELLVRVAAERTPSGAVVVDLCCGSGAVGLALLTCTVPRELHAVDLDPAAVRCAHRNLEPLGGRVHEGDLYAPLPDRLRGAVDVLVANAPYVPTGALGLLPREARLHEPALALDGGGDGLDVHRRILASAREWLAPGGSLLLETSERQAGPHVELLAQHGFGSQVHTREQDGATVVVGSARRRRTDRGPSRPSVGARRASCAG